MKLPEPNTPAELEWFAREGMGWLQTLSTSSVRPTFHENGGLIFVSETGKRQRIFNPRTSLADAVELADAVFATRTSHSGLDPDEKRLWTFMGIVHDYQGNVASSHFARSRIGECDAICEAVREKLGQDGEVTDA